MEVLNKEKKLIYMNEFPRLAFGDTGSFSYTQFICSVNRVDTERDESCSSLSDRVNLRTFHIFCNNLTSSEVPRRNVAYIY